MSSTEQPAAPPSGHSEVRLVARNTSYLAAAQIITIPVSAALNALYARFLGPAEFGLFYLAGTMCALGILVAEWGQQGTLPALVARDRSQAAGFLGTGFAWRGAASGFIYLLLAGIAYLLGKDGLFHWILAACFIQAVLNSLAGGYKDAIRGFERTDIPAIAHVVQQLLLFVTVVAVLVVGGRLNALLITGIFVPMVIVVGLSRASRRVGIGPLEVKRANFGTLMLMGTPFVFNDIAMALQPIVDAMFLSRLAPDEVTGLYAVTRRLIGVLILPATALIGSLYPTLCRLWEESREGFVRTMRDALSGVALLAAPAALGCGLYPELGIWIFGREEFGPAETNLRVMAVFLFLVYFSLPIQSAVLAAGKRRAWSIIQCLCIGVSLTLDPLLIPWFQTHMGNGGIGLCVAAVLSESLVVIGGLVLMPRGIVDHGVVRTLLLTLLSGALMAAAAFAMKDWVNPFVAAPIAVIVYFVAALLTGAIRKSQRDAILHGVKRRMPRFF
jgi:O-antigen/teichoic acid export membrane protein